MNKTTFQNGASSQSPLYGHRSTPDTPTSQPQGGRLANSSSKHSSVTGTPVSNYKIRASEMFQSREVLLKMLQSSPVVYVPGSGCSLPHQVDGKACSKSDGSHCSRCINFQPPHNMVHVNSELTNEECSPMTKNGICVPPPNIGDQQSISYRETGEKHFQPHRGTVNVPCDEENLLRKRSFEKTRLLFPTTARCRTCEGSSQPFYPEELHLRAACCQHFLPENQKKINRSHCFPKETLPGDRSSVPLQKERQIEDNGAIHSNRETPRKDGGSINHRYPSFRFYRSCDSRPYQPPTSNQTLARDHPDMETSSDEVPVDVRPRECPGNDVAHNIIDRYHVVASSSTQGKPSDPSLPLPKGCGYTPSCPSDESIQDQGREERNTRLEKDSGKHNYACPHCPNPSPQEECTPVIVHCYSLSEPGSNSDSQIVNEPKSGTSHTISEGTTWIPDHSQCVHQQPPLKSHKPVNRLHLDEHVLYDAPAHRPRSNTFAHNHSFNTQPKHAMNESPTTDVGVDDEQEQNGSSLMLPSRTYENFRPPMNCRCLHCPPCPHENGYDKKCIQTARRIPYPYSKHCPEPRNTSESVSQIHISSGYHGMNTLPEADRQADVCNWPNRPVSNSGRPTLKIRDYYEERRILVEKFYEDIQGTVEEPESEENSDISYGDHHEDHQHRHPASAEVFQTPAFENSPFHIGVHQQDIVVGSRKRKNRTPRPQRVKSDDPAQFSGSEVTQDRSEESFKNRRHQQRNLSCHLGTLIPKEAWRKTREDVEVRGNENETRFYEDVQATVPVHPGWVRRCDDNFSKNTPSRSLIYRRDNSTDTRPPCHPLTEGSKSIEGCEPFLEFPRVPPRNVPSFGAISNMHRPTNRFSREHQKNTYYQSKIPQQNFVNSYEHAPKRPDNFESEWNIAQEHWHTSARREGSKTHLETLGKVGTGYENGYGTCPSQMRKASFSPSQHSIPNQGKAVFQIEMEFEPERNGEAMPGYAERHAAPTMDKHQSEDSNSSSSSLPSDHGSVPSTTLEDSDVLQKTHSSDQPQEQAYAPTDGEIARKPTDEQNVTFSESSNLLLQSQEMYGNFISPSIKERRFICRFCCKKFAHFSTLQNHVRTHTGDKPFQCKFCSRRFAQSGVLKAHLRTHTGDKPFVCMYCGKMFAQSTTLTNHLRTHTGQKPYICNYCGKSFSQPSTLRKHELSHTKERPYSCKFCGKAFAQQSTLTNHMRSHTGQRPYKCHFCEKSFAQLSTLDRHLRLHSSVIPKPHQCQYCSKSFSYVSNLASHMQVHQQEQQSKVA